MAYETINYEMFQQGGYSSLNSDYGNFVGYRLQANALGSPTGIQTANQLNEVVSRIREGVKNVELQPIQPDVFEQIPKQHFKEVRALMQLSGVRPSVHAPMLDPAGFGERGWQGDAAREDTERRLFSVIEKSQELDPNGNIPIVIHSSQGIPGTEWRPKKGTTPGDKDRFEEIKGVAINRETGEMAGLKKEWLFRPELYDKLDINAKPEEGNKLFTPKQRIESINRGQWEDSLTKLAEYNKHAEEVMGYAPSMQLAEYKNAVFGRKKDGYELDENKVIDLVTKKPLPPISKLTDVKKEAYNKLQQADIFVENAQLGFNGAFEKAFKYGSIEQRKQLKKLAEDYTKKIHMAGVSVFAPEKKSRVIGEALQKLQRITEREPPKTFVPVEEFAMEKAAETFGNLATKSYEKYGKNAPVLAVENWQPEAAFSRAEDMKKLLEASKKQFIAKATASKKDGGLGLSRGKAKKQADKMLGVTWDVGHINELRKFGFKKEDIIQQSKTIAPLVKHIHLTDNFGYSDSHLVPGMGNVPIKEILKEMEKAGRLKDTRAIVEAGVFAQQFKTSPHPLTMAAFGSPIYGAKMAPYWNQVMGTQGSYFEFPMAYMPEKHFSIYGSGFSMLPEELGGQMPGTQSRFAGTPNA